jgi:hypothetical protein
MQLRRQLASQNGFQDEGHDEEPDERENHEAAHYPQKSLSQNMYARQLWKLHIATFSCCLLLIRWGYRK